MARIRHTLIITVLSTAAFYQPAVAQVPTMLEIDIENFVEYQTDTMDTSLYSISPVPTPSAGIIHFAPAIAIGDIVAVNGEPVKGTFVGRPWDLSLSTVFRPGRAIADITRISVGFRTFEILKVDGTPIGTLMVLGLNGGPLDTNFGTQNFAIVGGTGAFLGALGQQGGRQIPGFTIPPRAASIVEDPAYRRQNGGGRVRWRLAVIPTVAPEVAMSDGKRLISHVDSSLVTPGNPSSGGEVLSLFATGLGPTVPGVDFGQPFPSQPPAVVNSPLKVTVNGIDAEVLTAIGVPGSLDTYEIRFQVPSGTAPGLATVQITAAWIKGTAVTVPIR
jgi:uncharacterized protein (TIGR03437 family)